MAYLNNGASLDFNAIRDELIYALSAGRHVDDYIGYSAEEGYDFDFVDEADTLVLKIGNETYSATKLDAPEGYDSSYGFKLQWGEDGSPKYLYTVNYVRGNGTTEEHFVWNIEENVSNFAPASLSYLVTLVQKNDAPGAHDAETNQRATLYQVDSNGDPKAPEDFEKPVVSYTNVKVTKVWDDTDDQNGRRPAGVTMTLKANGETVADSAVTLNAENGWTYTWSDLRFADDDGNAITYSVVEDAVDRYTAAYADDGNGSFTVTNRHVPTPTGGSSSSRSTPTPTPETPVVIEDEEVPLAETPVEIEEEEVPLTEAPATPAEIEDQDVPLAAAPAAPAAAPAARATIADTAVPLANPPRTADDSMNTLWGALALVSAMGIAALALSGRKQRHA